MQGKDTILSNVRMSFLKRGLTISAWSKLNNFNTKATVKILHRYAEKQQIPQSPFVYDVLTQLKTDTGINLMEKGE